MSDAQSQEAPAAAQRLLEVSDVSVRFGGIVALDGVSFDVDAGPDRRPDRPERRRQDHAVQLPVAALRVRRAAASSSTASRCSACRATASPRSASAARSRTSRCSARMTVLDNVMVGRHCRTAQRLLRQCAAPAARCGARSARDARARARAGRTSLGLDARRRHAGRATCRSARRSASSWRARWPASRSCCCSTSRPAASTTRRSARSAS